MSKKETRGGGMVVHKKRKALLLGVLIPLGLFCCAGVNAGISTSQGLLASNINLIKTDIGSLFPRRDMGRFSSNNEPKNNEVIQFLYEQVQGGPNQHVINDLTVGTRRTSGAIVTVPVSAKDTSAEYQGSIDLTYEISPKTALSSLFTKKNNTTPPTRNFWSFSNVANQKFELDQFKTLNNIANFQINQISMQIVYATDAAIKNRTGTLTLTANATSSVYSGSVTLNFAFVPPLDKVLTVGTLEQGYNTSNPTVIKENLIISAYTNNIARISDFTFFKNNVSVKAYTSFTSVTFVTENASVYSDTAILSIFDNYKITPPTIFTYSGNTITGFTSDNLDLSSYNTLVFPDTYNGYDITTISKNFDPTANTGTAYNSLSAGGSLKYLYLPAKLTKITGVFSNCNSFIGEIYFPSTFTSGSNYLFQLCRNITSVKFGGTACTAISQYMFDHCEKLKYIDLPNNMVTIDENGLAYSESSLSSVYLPDSVTKIGNRGIKQTGVKTLYLGQVKTINTQGFRNNPLVSITANYSTLPVAGTN
jgi:hypothetical protein